MEEERTEKLPIRSSLRALGVGQIISFPAIQAKSVKVSASEIGFELGRTFKTTQNRDTRTLDVVRVV